MPLILTDLNLSAPDDSLGINLRAGGAIINANNALIEAADADKFSKSTDLFKDVVSLKTDNVGNNTFTAVPGQFYILQGTGYHNIDLPAVFAVTDLPILFLVTAGATGNAEIDPAPGHQLYIRNTGLGINITAFLYGGLDGPNTADSKATLIVVSPRTANSEWDVSGVAFDVTPDMSEPETITGAWTFSNISLTGALTSAGINSPNATSFVYLAGSTFYTSGGAVLVYGGSHATRANDIEVLSNNIKVLEYDNSVNNLALGRRAVGTHFAGLTVAGEQYAASGDNQFLLWQPANTTINNTPTLLWLDEDGVSSRMTVASGKMYAFQAHIVGVQSDGTDACYYVRRGIIANNAGTTALIGTIQTDGTDIESNAACDVSVTANNTTDNLDITVTGITAETWRWSANVFVKDITIGT